MNRLHYPTGPWNHDYLSNIKGPLRLCLTFDLKYGKYKTCDLVAGPLTKIHPRSLIGWSARFRLSRFLIG